ncbi:MAG: hypothetical protein DRP85_07385 [Candidatus Makaraimicrobium thalassicum]|nr:MAG: hypothetical protein DRP85_07385 [Candidatus Omnitrophota bacterium]
MNVSLVRPYWRIPQSYYPPVVTEPLGLEYLASAIREEHNVSILDCLAEDYNGWSKNDFVTDNYNRKIVHIGLKNKQITKKIKKFNPEAVGIGYDFFPQLPCANEISQLTKKVNKDIIVIAGGPQASSDPDTILERDNSVDIVNIGEGEITFKELLDKKFRNLKDIKGIAYKKKGKVIKTKPRPPIMNLDTIAFPARDLVPFNTYSKLGRIRGKSRTVDKIINLPIIANIRDKIFKLRFPRANILTSRGCPNHCYFCSVHNVWGHKYRMRSASNVLEEINQLVNNYNVKSLYIQDDNFTISKKRTLEICKGLEKLDITYTMPSGVYIPSLDKEILESIKKSGCTSLYFGIENGNEKYLNDITQKKLDLNQVHKVITECKNIGITTTGYFILGMLGETKQTMKDTINFAITSKLDKVRLYTCMPIPGSRLYKDCIKQNAIKNFDPLNMMVQSDMPSIESDKFSIQDVLKLKNTAKKKLKDRDAT